MNQIVMLHIKKIIVQMSKICRKTLVLPFFILTEQENSFASWDGNDKQVSEAFAVYLKAIQNPSELKSPESLKNLKQLHLDPARSKQFETRKEARDSKFPRIAMSDVFKDVKTQGHLPSKQDHHKTQSTKTIEAPQGGSLGKSSSFKESVGISRESGGEVKPSEGGKELNFERKSEKKTKRIRRGF